MMWEHAWNPADRINRARRGAEASRQTQETPPRRGDGLPVGFTGLTVADVPRLLRGLALVATGVETVLLPRRAVSDTTALNPAVAVTVRGENTITPRLGARAPDRLTGRVAALQDRLSARSAPLTSGVVAATIRARQARDVARQTVTTARTRAALVTTGHLVPQSGSARRVALGGLLGVGVLAVLLSPLRDWVWGRVRRTRSGTDGPDTTSLVQTAQQDASRTPTDTSELDDATLVDKVESAIFRDPALPKGRININAERGRVVLRGEVDQPEQISALEVAVRQVSGVKDVENLLHLPGTSVPQS